MEVSTHGIWEGLEDKMLELLRHNERQIDHDKQKERGGKLHNERMYVGINPLLLSLRDAVRQGGEDFLLSHVRAYEHRILEIQSQIKERNRNYAHLTRVSSSSSLSSSPSALEQEMNNIKLEQDIWKLIDSLNKCEQRHQQQQQQQQQQLSSYFSEKEVVHFLKMTNKSLDWNFSIVEWLESLQTPYINVKGASYSSSSNSSNSNMSTVEKLRLQTELQRQVESIDPDTQFRHSSNTNSQEIEKEDESLLCDIWYLLRAGLLKKGVDLCRDREQHWRASSLNGNEYWYDGGKENDPMYVEGNRKRMLWRVSCLQLAKHTPSLYERSIYGVLAGDLDLVLKGNNNNESSSNNSSSSSFFSPSSALVSAGTVRGGGGGENSLCKTWEDICWLKFKTQVSEEVDNRLFHIFQPQQQQQKGIQKKEGEEGEESCIRALVYDDLGYAQAQQETPFPSAASSSFTSSSFFPNKKFSFLSTRTSIIHELEKDFLISKENFSMRYHYIMHQLISEQTPRTFAHDFTYLLFHPQYANLFFLPQNASFLVFIVHLHIYYKYFSATANVRKEKERKEKGGRRSSLSTTIAAATTTNDSSNSSNNNSDDENYILAFYIVYLISTKTYDVPDPHEQSTIVDYFTYLPPPKKIRMYAKFLQGLHYKTTKRNHFIQAAKKNFHPEEVFFILIDLVNNIQVEKGEKNSYEHVKDKLDALRWLVEEIKHNNGGSSNNIEEKIVFVHANYLFRLFWEWKTNLSSPTVTPNFKPFSKEKLLELGLSLSEVISKLKVNKNTPEGWEFLCWSQYYSCLKKFLEFSLHIHHEPTVEKKEDKMLYDQWATIRQQGQKEIEKNVKKTIELCAQRTGGGEMKCVPELIDLLARTYMACENYQQCLSLADDVADQKLCLYEFFAPEEMEQFLGTMRAAFLQTLPTEQVNHGSLSVHY